MSAHDALQLIDGLLADSQFLDGNVVMTETLEQIRYALVADPSWSDVQEANLRTRLAAAEARADAAVAEAAEEQRNHEAAEAQLRRERDSARRWAVRLEQDLALAGVGVPPVASAQSCITCGEPATYRLGMPTPCWCDAHGPQPVARHGGRRAL